MGLHPSSASIFYPKNLSAKCEGGAYHQSHRIMLCSCFLDAASLCFDLMFLCLCPAAGSWLAMVITYTLSIGLSFFVVKATRKSWDYITTASLLHLILCIISEWLVPSIQHLDDIGQQTAGDGAGWKKPSSIVVSPVMLVKNNAEVGLTADTSS